MSRGENSKMQEKNNEIMIQLYGTYIRQNIRHSKHLAQKNLKHFADAIKTSSKKYNEISIHRPVLRNICNAPHSQLN